MTIKNRIKFARTLKKYPVYGYLYTYEAYVVAVCMSAKLKNKIPKRLKVIKD